MSSKRRLSSRAWVVHVITAAVAGGTMGLAVLGLLLADWILALGYLPGAAPLLILATTAVAALRAEEAVATRSPLRWAWGSSWRSLVISGLGSALILTLILSRAGVEVSPSTAEDVSLQYVLIVTFFFAPVPLVLGIVAHLAASLAIRRALVRWWAWFATSR